jgi:hypothetical protein
MLYLFFFKKKTKKIKESHEMKTRRSSGALPVLES